MKKITFSLFLAAALLVCAASAIATPDQEKAFMDSYKKAFEAKDAVTLESLLYTKNADPAALEFYKMMMTSEMGAKIAEIQLRNLTPEEIKQAAETMPSMTGGESKLPLTPSKKLVLNIQSGEGNKSSSETFVAEVDGKLMIPVPVAVN